MPIKFSRDIVDGLTLLESEFEKNARVNPITAKAWEDRAKILRLAISEIEHLRKFAPKEDH